MADFKDQFEPIFKNKIKEIINEQKGFHSFKVPLDEDLENIILDYTSGGKRIRPFLIYYFSNVSDSDVTNACLATELFHLAALIHDDMMDQSQVRRGVPTIHTATQKFAQHNNHLGTDIGLLLGDVFLIESIALAHTLPKNLGEEFRTMAQRTTRGQYIDSFGMNTGFGLNTIHEIKARHELKTAWYTFVSPFRIGYLLGNNDIELCETLSGVLCELGLLFQIRDDIIDCIDDNSGKKRFSDILENQTTWVTLHIKEHYPLLFSEIAAIREKEDVQILHDLFKKIDLHTPYEVEFEKCREIIEKLPKQNIYREKCMEVLSLLSLN